MAEVEVYDAETSKLVYTNAAGRQGRGWAKGLTIENLAAVGIIDFFEGPGDDPTVLPGYASGKYWLRTEAGVTETAPEVRRWNGGAANLLASWPLNTALDVADAVAKKHTHANLAVLDAFSDNGAGTPEYNGQALALAETSDIGTSYAFGWTSPVATGTVAADDFTIIMQQTFAVTTTIARITMGASSSGTGRIYVVTMSGNTVASIVREVAVPLTAGVNVIAANIVVQPGQRIGFSNRLLFNAAAGNPAVWVKSGRPLAGDVLSSSTLWRYEIRFEAETGLVGRVSGIDGRVTVNESTLAPLVSTVGTEETRGWPTIVGTGSDVPANYSIILNQAAALSGWITEATIGSAGASTSRIYVATMSGNVATIVSTTTIALAAGVNVVKLAIPIAAGQFIGISNGYKFQNSSNPQGLLAWFKSGAINSGDTITLSSLHRYEVSFRVQTGYAARLRMLEDGTSFNDGTAILVGADASGVADATSLFSNARVAHAHPYVRPGTFSVTSLVADGAGFWGPGTINVNGRRFFIPPDPDQGNLYDGLRAALAPEIANGAPLVLIGDSIAHWSAASQASRHWFNMLTAFGNIVGSPGDEPVLTALRPVSTYTPAFYGVTTAGTVTTGTNGPLGESIILAAGASLSFTGAYEQVDVWYTQQAGAGTLSFAYNAGAAYKTVNAAGATDLDRYSGPSATGQTASGTYTITASGGSVEITGLLRLGVKTAGTPERLITHRAARGSFRFTNYTGAQITSLLKQCSALSTTPPYVIIALGINDRADLTPSQYATMRTRARDVILALKTGGVTRMAAIMPQEPTSAWSGTYSGRLTQAQLLGALTEVYQQENVTIIPTHQYDAANEGLFADGLHSNDAGNAKLAQVAIESLADRTASSLPPLASGALPLGGTAGQFLRKSSSTNFDAAFASVVAADISNASANGRSLITAADYAAMRGLLGLTIGTNVREVLTAGRTYFVRPDGNDANTGLANNAGGAFLTLQKAVDVVAALDTSIFNVTVNVADGTYAPVTLKDPIGAGTCSLVGNATTPANVIINTGTCINAGDSVRWQVSGFTLSGSIAVLATNNARVTFNGLMRYGTCTSQHFNVSRGATVVITGNYEIFGGASTHWQCEVAGRLVCNFRTITLTGTPAMSFAFAYCADVSAMYVGVNTFSGSATGTRYSAAMNGAINTLGAGVNYLPGSVAGTTATGGQYA